MPQRHRILFFSHVVVFLFSWWSPHGSLLFFGCPLEGEEEKVEVEDQNVSRQLFTVSSVSSPWLPLYPRRLLHRPSVRPPSSCSLVIQWRRQQPRRRSSTRSSSSRGREETLDKFATTSAIICAKLERMPTRWDVEWK